MIRLTQVCLHSPSDSREIRSIGSEKKDASQVSQEGGWPSGAAGSEGTYDVRQARQERLTKAAGSSQNHVERKLPMSCCIEK